MFSSFRNFGEYFRLRYVFPLVTHLETELDVRKDSIEKQD